MKKLRAIIVAIVLTILMIVFASSVNSATEELPLGSIGNQVYDKSTGKYCYQISANTLAKYNNFYCVEHGAWFPAQSRWMYVASTVTINGNVATFNNSQQCEGEFNNILAAILCDGELGYGTSQNNYNDSQVALYYYWNDWLSQVRAETGSRFGMEASSSNDSIVNQYNASAIFDWYQSCASQYAYNVTIYFMKVNAAPHVQNLIIVERGPKTELDIDIPVEKVWLDGDNKFDTRKDITVELLANGASTGNKLPLNKSNNWKSEFTDLDVKDSNGNKINYTVKELDVPSTYTTSISGNMNNGFKITNTLLTEVKVVKEWKDEDDLDEYRPTSLKVTLYSNGVSTGKTVTLDANNNWTATFEKLHKYDAKGNEINYTVQEETIEKYEKPVYNKAEDSKNGYITWTITNTHIPHYDGYIEITGKVWEDVPYGKFNDINGAYNKDEEKDILLPNITVRLKYVDENGTHRLFNENLPNVYETKTDPNGEYKIVVNYDKSKNVYKLYEDVAIVEKKLETAYIEFEYDGMKYTTVANADSGENTSKAIEDEKQRNSFDSNHSTIIPETTHADNWTDKNITAVTKKVNSYTKGDSENRTVVVKYCNGNGTCDRTHPEGAWMIIEDQPNKYVCEKCQGTGHTMRTFDIAVENIPNINLGLFKREQPDVAIFSDLKQVEVTMRGQKYTYIYGVRGSDKNDVGLQAKFQDKDTYTYRRPVNPADIAYIQEEANKNEMSVLVTYEVKVANLSNTLQITVDNIINSFDSEYTLNTPGWTVTDAAGFKQATSGDLNITVEPQHESPAIELQYTVSIDAIRNLLNENATLNNAVEIGSYTTRYGVDTLYAEQGVGKRTGQPYGGYDYDSHPGNANIQLKTGSDGIERLYSTDAQGNIISIDKVEDDTDIAPSFVLCPDDQPKTLAGTVWEDVDANSGDQERLGNGKFDSTEKIVENVKVELYEIVRDENGNITSVNEAKLYNSDTKQIDKNAVAYTEADGSYKLDGVVTGEYYAKYTYGDDTTKLGHEATTMDGGTTKVNARNYKSTVITDPTIIDATENSKLEDLLKQDYTQFTETEQKWHIIHEDGRSVAVDNMMERLNIEDLYYSNFNNALNMTAYTKPFKTQLEFEATGSSNVDSSGNIEGVSETLDRLDFGIAERPREDLFAQKIITNLKIRLANGQVLTEGNPSNPNANINYVKTMGFSQKVNSGEAARNALDKQLLVEMDTELIQGAQLELQYAVQITNNSELDYDYGNKEDADYIAEFGDINKQEYDKYITQNSKANYYYFGNIKKDNGEELNPIEAKVEIADYIDKELVNTADSSKWTDMNEDLITDTAKAAINKGYKAYQGLKESSTKISVPRRVENAYVLDMSVTKLLANQDENVFDNNIEILSIDGKTARTIQESNGGVQIEKSYKPGNYVPSLDSGTFEQDDDRVKIMITPPTGATYYIITYVITGLLGLVLILAGIVFIKKKVLIK